MSCAINKISQFSSVKILNKIQNLLKMLKLIQGNKYSKIEQVCNKCYIRAVIS